jgi:hypothetical protein
VSRGHNWTSRRWQNILKCFVSFQFTSDEDPVIRTKSELAKNLHFYCTKNIVLPWSYKSKCYILLCASHISTSLYDTNIKECSQTFVLLLLCSQQFSLYRVRQTNPLFCTDSAIWKRGLACRTLYFQCNKLDPYYTCPRSLVHMYLHICTPDMSHQERNIFTKPLFGFCLFLQERIQKKDTATFIRTDWFDHLTCNMTSYTTF